MSSRPLLRTSRADVSARKTYDLIDEPSGRDYDALIDAALGQCAVMVLTTTGEPLPANLEQLAQFQLGAAGTGSRRVQRFSFNRDSAAVLKRAARSLYAWRQPSLPQDLCLLRGDGSPWLVSIAAERIGYLELTPFEKLLLGRAAPGLAAVLAHHAARDAVLAFLERRYESHVDSLSAELAEYAAGLMQEGRDQLVDALAAWLGSKQDLRVSVALEVTRSLGLRELRREVTALLDSPDDPASVPDAFGNNVVLRERWRSRRRRLLEAAHDAVSAPQTETG